MSKNKKEKNYYLLNIILVINIVFASGVFAAESGFPRFEVELEAGPVWQSRNDVQIPNNKDGTRFSLVDLAGNGPYPAGRVYLTWNANKKHGLRVLWAPLTIRDSAVLGTPASFEGTDFNSGINTEATYKFNSYRVTYRYRFNRDTRFDWWLGFTAKIRDAKIRLEQPGRSAEKTDVGFVPLLHLGGIYHFTPRWKLLLDLDALAGGPGRAEDVALKIRYDIGGRWSVLGGYRTIEGGADVDQVYTLAWLHYAVFSCEVRL